MYLYKYGLVGGSNLEIIGRTDLGDWVLIQAIGGMMFSMSWKAR
ncbi:MAG TPA: hypothetical protein VI451_10560 [Anaerolineales bacterium]|jgi:hypothetical protein|nr:hypothetical protein [Anaerolineales bacterium]